MERMLRVIVCLLSLFTGIGLVAQETVFNVPSGDVLDRGKVYTEFDFSYRHVDDLKTFTPRVVVGIGHRVEIGANVNNIVTPGPSQATITPTIKWKLYDGGDNGWAFLAGDNLFIPVQNKTFSVGTWTYAEFAKTLKVTKTRLTFGGYYFSRDVVAPAQRGGGQFAVEQPAGKSVTFAVDWLTGKHGAGYVSPGAFIKLGSKVTWYVAYQVGNGGVSEGNHSVLTEIGWNLN